MVSNYCYNIIPLVKASPLVGYKQEIIPDGRSHPQCYQIKGPIYSYLVFSLSPFLPSLHSFPPLFWGLLASSVIPFNFFRLSLA